MAADADIARRLAIALGDPVMSTRYLFLADDEPIQLSHSREPLAVTGGTPVEWPEDGATVGVVARMDLIGVRVDESVERITARPAIAIEAQELRLPARAPLVFVIERTYYAAACRWRRPTSRFPATVTNWSTGSRSTESSGDRRR